MSKYFKKKSFLFFLIFPYFNPLALKYIPKLNILYNVIQGWKLIAIICILIAYLLRGRISSVIGMIIILEVISILSSLFNGVYELKVFSNAVIAISMAMLTEIAIKINFKKFCDVYFQIIATLLIINFIFCIIYPNGLTMATLYTTWGNPIYFLSIDNGMIREMIPLLVMANYKKSKMTNSKICIQYYSIIFVSLMTLVIVDSTTGIITYLIFSGLLILYSEVLKEKYSYKILAILYIAFMLLIVLMGSEIEIINSIIRIFGRSTTFTGRTFLWKKAIQKIVEKPLIGYGYTSGNIAIWGGYYSSHNMFLEMLLQNGFIFLILFILLNYIAFVRCKKASVQYFNLVFGGIFAYLLVGLMESAISPIYFMLIVMAWYPDAQLSIKTRAIRFLKRI